MLENTKCRIEGNMSMIEAIGVLSENNPTAVTTLVDVLDQKDIDPDSFGPLATLLMLDTARIYGNDIASLFEFCEARTEYFVAVCRAIQLGIVSKENVREWIKTDGYRSGNKETAKEIYNKVKEQLPNFGKSVEDKIQKDLPAPECLKIEIKENKILVSSEKYTPTQFAKRFFFLAYEACGSAMGMGLLQARREVTEEDVWQNVVSRGDYPGRGIGTKTDRPYADYVFGRMMKVGLDLHEDHVVVQNMNCTTSYQAWCKIYPTCSDLVTAVGRSLEAEAA